MKLLFSPSPSYFSCSSRVWGSRCPWKGATLRLPVCSSRLIALYVVQFCSERKRREACGSPSATHDGDCQIIYVCKVEKNNMSWCCSCSLGGGLPTEALLSCTSCVAYGREVWKLGGHRWRKWKYFRKNTNILYISLEMTFVFRSFSHF